MIPTVSLAPWVSSVAHALLLPTWQGFVPTQLGRVAFDDSCVMDSVVTIMQAPFTQMSSPREKLVQIRDFAAIRHIQHARHMFSSTHPLLCVSTAKANVLELELTFKCLKKSVSLKRNLNDAEYVSLFKDADPCIDTMYVKSITTLSWFTTEKAKQELAKVAATMSNLPTSSTGRFMESTKIVKCSLHGGKVSPCSMGKLPHNMKEVNAVKIDNSYFDDIDMLCVRTRYYPPLWEDVKRNLTALRCDYDLTIVVGQPGIGKSVGFGNYCVLRCMMDLTKTIIIVISIETVNVLVPNARSWKQFTAFTSALHSLSSGLCSLVETLGVGDHNALIVHDIKSANGFKALPFQDGFLRPLRKLVARVHTVVLTSPEESNYGLALKAGVAAIKYLPVWSKYELESTQLFDVKNKFDYCGGVPRSYRYPVEDVYKAQIKASRKFDPNVMCHTELTDRCPSELVQLDMGPHFDRIVGLSPVSMSAEGILRRSSFNGVSSYYHQRVQSSRGTEKGLNLKKWFMFWVRGSTDAPITCIIENVSDATRKTLTINPKCYVQVSGNTFERLFDAVKASNLKVGQSVLVQPISPNFPVVGMLLFTKVERKGISWEVDAFQVTVSPFDAPKALVDKFVKCFARRHCTLRHFVWVGFTDIAGSDPNGSITSSESLSNKHPFFAKKQYRLDMGQLLSKTRSA